MYRRIIKWFKEYSTPKRIHERGDCFKARQGYRCYGNNNYKECE